MSEAISIEDQKDMATEVFAKEGYKKTKLGWIPEDWETPCIDEIFEFLSTNSFSRSLLNYKEDEGIYNIHYGDIHATFKRPLLDFNIENRIPKVNNGTPLSQNIDYLKDGDLIIADASEDYEGIGEAIELKNIGKNKVISGLHTFAFRDKNKKTAEGFRVYILRNLLVKKALKTIATGSKVYGISKGNIQKFRVVLPPLPEQQKIAAILSTWDNAIGKQEQLIASKKHFKKGLMQLLLTGKKRLPGFCAEWETKTLGELCEIKGDYGINAASVPFDPKLPTYLRITDIDEDGKFKVQNKTSVNNQYSKNFYLEEEDIVFARTGASVGKTYLHKSENGKLVFAGFLIRFRTNPNKLTPYFLRQYVNSNKYWNWVRVFSVRSGQPGINSKEYAILPISIPPISEQKKISIVFKMVDKEIALLQTQLTQLQSQKRGLMQKLLTGEMRVKI